MKATENQDLLNTPSDLAEKGRQDVSDALNPIVADYFSLYIKTKNYHWHVTGRHFRDYHRMLDEQGAELIAAIDPLAERIRKLGFSTIRSIGHITQLTKVKDNDEDFVAPADMLSDLVQENQQLIKRLRAAHEVCDNVNDVASASLIENYIDEAEKRVWFLFESSRDIG